MASFSPVPGKVINYDQPTQLPIIHIVLCFTCPVNGIMGCGGVESPIIHDSLGNSYTLRNVFKLGCVFCVHMYLWDRNHMHVPLAATVPVLYIIIFMKQRIQT